MTVKCLEDFGLNLSNMVSLATDGASVMTDRKTGVESIKIQVFPILISDTLYCT